VFTAPLSRLLLPLPVLLVPAAALSGLLHDPIGLALTTLALAAYVLVIWHLAQRPQRLLAERARSLAEAGDCPDRRDKSVWQRLDTCLGDLQRRHASDEACIRELRDRLARAEDAAQGANSAKRTFITNIGHEIRTPINVIVGMTRLALKEPSSAQQASHLRQVDQAAQGLLEQLNDVLDLVKLETGEMRLHRAAFDVAELLRILRNKYAPEASRKGLVLKTDLGDAVPTELIGDAERIRQILSGLLDNAIKFTESGGISLSVRLLDKSAQEASVEFEVRDSGVGIPDRMQPEVFDLFRQADESISRRHGGSGLGLNLSHRLASAMGGALRIESRSEVGTSFRLELRMGLGAKEHANLGQPSAAVDQDRSSARLATIEPIPRPPPVIPEQPRGRADVEQPAEAGASPPARLNTELDELAAQLAQSDAAAINSLDRISERLRASAPAGRIDALQQAVHGFDFIRASRLLAETIAALPAPTPQRDPQDGDQA
jgi:signal transduction histidine kinase